MSNQNLDIWVRTVPLLCRKLDMIPVECIVRGYITGSGWASYQKDGTVCGICCTYRTSGRRFSRIFMEGMIMALTSEDLLAISGVLDRKINSAMDLVKCDKQRSNENEHSGT